MASQQAEPIGPVLSDKAASVLASLRATVRMDVKRRSLSPLDKTLWRFILITYPLRGRAPSLHELRDSFPDVNSLDLARALARLNTLDLLYRDRETGEILGAYPFSSLPTPHRISFPGEPAYHRVYAMCAIDAMGIPFMLGKPVAIRSSCAHGDGSVDLKIQDGAIHHLQPQETVVFAGTKCSGHAATSLCTTLVFFCNHDHATAWRKSRGESSGAVLTPGEALAVGKGLFGNLFSQDDADR